MQNMIRSLLRRVNLDTLETQIGLQCAPVLCKIKISNLLIIDSEYVKSVSELFAASVYEIILIFHDKTKSYYLIYSRNEMEEYLRNESICNGLKKFGYIGLTFEQTIEIMARRYENYMKSHESFPHEIGILLGYPLQDVYEFVRNQGRNPQYQGYWKGYTDINYCRIQSQRYQKAKEIVLKYLIRGGTISRLLQIE